MKSYWDHLFRDRTTKFSHEEYLEEDILKFKLGKLLDIGAGDGRNALFLRNCGFDVTCSDYSMEGLKVLFDVYKDEIKLFHTLYDTITMIHFFPDVDIVERLLKLLTPNGTLYGLTFINDDLDRDSSKFAIGISQQEIIELRGRYSVIIDEIREDERGELYMFLIRSLSE